MLKSLGQAFLKACRVEVQSPSWVLRAKPLTSLAPNGRTKFAHFRLMLLTKEKSADFVRRSGAKECWASPKGILLSAESDKGVALDL